MITKTTKYYALAVAIALLLPAITQATLNDSIGWWTLDQNNTAPNTIFDSSSFQQNGSIIYGSLQFIPQCKLGGCYNFSITGGNIGVNNTNYNMTGQSYTINAWINQNDLGINQNCWILSYWEYLGASNGYGAGAFCGSTISDVRLYAYGNGGFFSSTYSFGTFSQSFNTWYFLTYIINFDTGRSLIYVNASLIMNTSLDYQYNDTDITDVNIPLVIGGRENSDLFSGLIDEVSIWKRALDESEISELYNNSYGYSLFHVYKNVSVINLYALNYSMNHVPSNTTIYVILQSDNVSAASVEGIIDGAQSPFDQNSPTNWSYVLINTIGNWTANTTSINITDNESNSYFYDVFLQINWTINLPIPPANQTYYNDYVNITYNYYAPDTQSTSGTNFVIYIAAFMFSVAIIFLIFVLVKRTIQ